MPIRIKPKYRLKPCLLNLDSLKGISELVSREFDIATFSATDDIWEIYDENGQKFIKEVSNREKLDSFLVKAETSESNDLNEAKKIEIVFDAYQASVNLTADPKYQSWFEHFLFDLEKFLLKSSFGQKMRWVFNGINAGVKTTLVAPMIHSITLENEPYCKIIIKKKPPNTIVEGVTASLMANFIWMLLGAVGLLITQWILNTYGIDLNPFN